MQFTFDVTVNDLILMEVGQTSEQLLCVVDYNTFLKGTVLVQQMRHRATWNENKREREKNRSVINWLTDRGCKRTASNLIKMCWTVV